MQKTYLQQLARLSYDRTLVRDYVGGWLPPREPIDKTSTEDALRKLYALAGMTEPVMIWCESPFQVVVAPILIDLIARAAGREQLENRLSHPLWNRAYTTISRQLPQSLCERIARAGSLVPLQADADRSLWTELLSQMGAVLKQKLGVRTTEDLVNQLSYVSNHVWEHNSRQSDYVHGMQLRAAFRQLILEERVSGNRASIEGSGNTWRVPLAQEFLAQHDRKSSVYLAKKLGCEENWLKPVDAFYRYVWQMLSNAVEFTCWWFPDDPWLEAYAFPWHALGDDFSHATSTGIIEIFRTLARFRPVHLLYEEMCLISEDLSAVHTNGVGALHAENGAAMEFTDGFQVFSWHGVTVPDWLIQEPETMAVRHIENERNLEIRRVMIQRYGESRYCLDSGAKIVHEDECGILFRKGIPGDEPLVMVRVTNSTPEPDSSYKHYFLRVPPTVTNARQAVAWTFGMSSDEYQPVRQT